MDPTVVIVGISIKENDEKYDDLPFGSVDEECDKPTNLCQFLAGYEDHHSGPTSLIGVKIKETWNDAIDLDKYAQKITKARKLVKQKTGKEPKLWVIGHQT